MPPKKDATDLGFASLLGKRRRGRQEIPVYLEQPTWGAAGKFGGSRMTVVLGPKSCESTNRGTATTPGSIKRLMNKLKEEAGDMNWKAGHLLNQDMGGSGTDTLNLTPLSGTANATHSGYENRIKKSCGQIGTYHEMNPGETHWYGIRYTVTVADTPLGDGVLKNAASHITVDAQLVKQAKGTTTIVDTGPGDPAFSFIRIDNRQVDN